MSGGGGKLEKINTRERAVSTDINRLQAFIQYDRAEVARRLMGMRNTTVPFNTQAGGGGGAILEQGSYIDTSANDVAAIGTPLIADVLDGLVVLPQSGTLTMLVSPGAVWLNDPDGQAGSSDSDPPNPDDSRYKLVIDPGLQTVGVLVFAAGAGSTRIDVVECQRVTTIVETDNRDIFDPSTGLFSAVAVTKVTEGRLTYRVRQGTPGGGLPANVQGWLPLMVASIPSTATTIDTMQFWDVRPLVKDRVNAPLDSQSIVACFDQSQRLFVDDVSFPGTKLLVTGTSTSQIAMYRAGGFISQLDLLNAVNQSAGFTPLAGFLWYLYAIFPGNLPRWAAYTTGAPFVPGRPNGIIVIATVGPTTTDGLAVLNNINVPNATGLLSSGPAVMLCSGFCNSTPLPAGLILQGGLVLSNYEGTKAPTSSTSVTDVYNFVANTNYPKPAKTVLFIFAMTLSAGTPAAVVSITPFVQIRKPGSGTVINSMRLNIQNAVFDSGGFATFFLTAEVPCIPDGTGAGLATDNLELTVAWGQSAGTKGAQTCTIRGWRL